MNKVGSIFIITLIAIVVYSNSFYNPFIWDDTILIVENPYIKNVNNFLRIFRSDLFPFAYEGSNYYRPLQSLTYMLDYAIWQLNPLGFHITNILLHSIVGYLIFTIFALVTKKIGLSLVTSLFFVVHPIHTEAVTYISGRADCLVALFFLLSLILHVKYTHFPNSKLHHMLSLLAFVFALLSKEIAIALPFVIILYDSHFPINRKTKNKLVVYRGYFLILGLYVFLRMTVLNFSSQRMPILNIKTGTDFILKLATDIQAVVIYMRLLLFPFNLHMERVFTIPNSIWTLNVIASAILLVLIMLYVIKIHKRNKLISLGSAWFLLNLVPVLNIFLPQERLIMAEHWLYLPSIGFFMVLWVVFDKLSKLRKKMTFAVLILLLSLYSFLTMRQNLTWKDSLEFYKRIIAFTPNNYKAHFNLALAYEEKGDFDIALEEYKRVLDIDPNYFLTYNNIGNIYASKGLYGMAMVQYRQCIKSEPDYFLAYNNLGNIYMLTQEYDMAIEQYKKSINLNPDYSESHNNLGYVYTEKNDFQNAEIELRSALKLNPKNAEAYNNFGNLYLKRDLYNEAIEKYEQAIKIKPDLDKAHFNLGVVYYKKGSMAKARDEWKKTLKINPNHTGALKNLKGAFLSL